MNSIISPKQRANPAKITAGATAKIRAEKMIFLLSLKCYGTISSAFMLSVAPQIGRHENTQIGGKRRNTRLIEAAQKGYESAVHVLPSQVVKLRVIRFDPLVPKKNAPENPKNIVKNDKITNVNIIAF